MSDEAIIQNTAEWVEKMLSGENSGHDWLHAKAVWDNSREILKSEIEANRLIIELAALLHDVNDWKNNTLSDEISAEMSEKWLKSVGLDEDVVNNIVDIIKKVSYFGPNFVEEEMSLEGKIVRDSDRLEAMGPIGWKRTTQFGKAKGIPDINEFLPNLNLTDEEYKNYMRKENSAINHMFEKMLLLKTRLVTIKGKELGKIRHEELKTTINEYLNGIMGKNIVSDERIQEYIKMLEEPRFN